MTRPHVLVLLQNLPLGRDARVKRECRTLLAAGYDVTVVCPRGDQDDPVPGVEVRSYPAPTEARRAWGFVREYAWSLVCTAVLTAQVRSTRRVDVVQACNPPDLFWVVALPLKALGARFVFDHHDLSPELWGARSGRTGGLVARALLLMERLTFEAADHVIATNDSVRQVALERGRQRPETVSVVRNGPELSSVRTGTVDPRPGDRPFTAVWLGVIGVDDGVELALRAVQLLVQEHRRTDCRFVFIGDGERLEHCRQLTDELGISAQVTFTGWLEHAEAQALLSTADVGLAPDPPEARAQRATMMKVMEYMAAGLPVVAFDVHETRVSAGEAGLYADEGAAEYARAIVALWDDPERRARMAVAGQQRILDGLSWDHQQALYLQVFERLLRSPR